MCNAAGAGGGYSDADCVVTPRPRKGHSGHCPSSCRYRRVIGKATSGEEMDCSTL